LFPAEAKSKVSSIAALERPDDQPAFSSLTVSATSTVPGGEVDAGAASAAGSPMRSPP
jgi:hypothetical protein